jgi:hypothetical protein
MAIDYMRYQLCKAVALALGVDPPSAFVWPSRHVLTFKIGLRSDYCMLRFDVGKVVVMRVAEPDLDPKIRGSVRFEHPDFLEEIRRLM